MSKTCAIYGVRNDFHSPDYSDKKELLFQTISSLIENGITSFITSAAGGYELDAALYLIQRKEANEDLSLTVVRPYKGYKVHNPLIPLVRHVIRGANTVKYIASSKSDYTSGSIDDYIMEQCDTMVCITRTNTSALYRLSPYDLSEKDVLYIPARKEIPAPPPQEESIYDKYPYTAISEIFSSKKFSIDVSQLPEDIEEKFESFYKANLTDRQVLIFEMRYKEGKSLQQIGNDLGLSRERIRQILVKEGRILRSRYRHHLTVTSTPAKAKPSSESNNNAPIKGSSAWSRWTPEEDTQLVEEYSCGMSTVDIASLHRRSTGAINARLKKMGLFE